LKTIYLDHNASCPIDKSVQAAMEPYLKEHFGNPSSKHWAGQAASQALAKARKEVARLIGAKESEIVFTSGGSEANNLAIKGIFHKGKSKGKHIITTAIEHPAVVEPYKYLQEAEGAEVTVVGVDERGIVKLDELKSALREETILISVMHANNETGAIQPISEIGKLAQERGIAFHSDAAQSVGKIPVNVGELHVSLLSLAAHKFYGPKGVGALFVKDGVELEPLIHGAAHENGRRAGTENVLLIVGLGAAATLSIDLSWTAKVALLREKLWMGLKEQFGEHISRNGLPELTLPNTLNCCIKDTLGGQLMAKMPEIAASTGSACHSACIKVSPVLAAMGIGKDFGGGALRFSLGRSNTEEEIELVMQLFKERL
jgi:cysteine desulfurase